MKKCPLCNGKVIKKNILTPYTYKNATITINQPQDYCEACREGFLSHEDIQATKRELADFKRKQDGLLSSDEIRSIRKKAGLTQEKAAEIFGGGVRAFHKYETGEVIQSKPLDIVLKLLKQGIVDLNKIENVARA